jgi:hypothetical protein
VLWARDGYYSVCHRLDVNKVACLQGECPVVSNILTNSGEQSVRLNMLVTYQAQSFWVRFYGVKKERYMRVPCLSVRL